MTPRRCKDCPPESKRPAKYAGPRCATHNREWLKRSKDLAHGRRLESVYEITLELYWRIYDFQGRRCALCQIATGKAKRLAVDHDHDLAATHDHPVDKACRTCVRGLLCGRCNRYGVPLTKPAIVRALEYLHNPPAQQVLAQTP